LKTFTFHLTDDTRQPTGEF